MSVEMLRSFHFLSDSIFARSFCSTKRTRLDDRHFDPDPTYRENAGRIQKAIVKANGLSAAADLIEHSLAVPTMAGAV